MTQRGCHILVVGNKRPTVVATGASNEKASDAENQQAAGGVMAAAGRTRRVPTAMKNKTMRQANDAKRTAAATVPSNQGGSAPAEYVPKNRNNNQASTQAGDDGKDGEDNGKNDRENNNGEGTSNSEVVVSEGGLGCISNPQILRLRPHNAKLPRKKSLSDAILRLSGYLLSLFSPFSTLQGFVP